MKSNIDGRCKKALEKKGNDCECKRTGYARKYADSPRKLGVAPLRQKNLNDLKTAEKPMRKKKLPRRHWRQQRSWGAKNRSFRDLQFSIKTGEGGKVFRIGFPPRRSRRPQKEQLGSGKTG